MTIDLMTATDRDIDMLYEAYVLTPNVDTFDDIDEENDDLFDDRSCGSCGGALSFCEGGCGMYIGAPE